MIHKRVNTRAGRAQHLSTWHDYTIGTLDMLQACDACADMGMTYSVIVQYADCVVFPSNLANTYQQVKPKTLGLLAGYTSKYGS